MMAIRHIKLLFLFPLLLFFISMFYFREKISSMNPNLLDLEQSWLTVQQRKAVLNSTCTKYKLYHPTGMPPPSVTDMMYVEHKYKFIYCEVPKVGCTNWKRILLLLKMNLSRNISELRPEFVHETSLHKKLSSYSPDKQKQLLNSYTKVMFAREPFERLVSAYRDKFLMNQTNEYYQKVIGNEIKSSFRNSIQSSGPVTFLEFVRFVLKEKPEYSDTHWRPMFLLCDPCNVRYDFIGKFDTLKEDSDQVLKSIRAPKHLRYPETSDHATNTSNDIAKTYFHNLDTEHLLGLVNKTSIGNANSRLSVTGWGWGLVHGYEACMAEVLAVEGLVVLFVLWKGREGQVVEWHWWMLVLTGRDGRCWRLGAEYGGCG